ncbi:MAG: hypothetical protein AAGA77_15280 [Bacteroidota bacterium]
MKNVIKIFVSMTLMLFVAVSINAQTATNVVDKSETKTCDITKCDPAKCDAMVKAGLCTKEEAEKCKAKCAAKSTKVAAASVEKVNGEVVATEAKAVKKASCAKTCTGKKKVHQ